MTHGEQEDGTTRDDLMQRVALTEEMIAEGRQSTAARKRLPRRIRSGARQSNRTRME